MSDELINKKKQILIKYAKQNIDYPNAIKYLGYYPNAIQNKVNQSGILEVVKKQH